MIEYENLNLYSLAFKLDHTAVGNCREIDPHLANKLKSIDDLMDIYFYICYGNMHQTMLLTREKINKILLQNISTAESIKFDNYRRFYPWLDLEVKSILLNKWLELPKIDSSTTWLVSNIDVNHDKILLILKRFTELYKTSKTYANLEFIESIFKKISQDKLEDACKVLADSTPATASILLSREDISEEYILEGLRALSKISKQKEISVKFDFNMLSKLGPRGRLDAMRHLLGIIGKKKTLELPFNSKPEKEDIDRFLFPCSIKYNDEVIEVSRRFVELLSQRR